MQELLALTDDETKWLENAYRRREPMRETLPLFFGIRSITGLRYLKATVGFHRHLQLGTPHRAAVVATLVREADRKDFEDLFAVAGLAPYSTIFPADMEDLLASGSRGPQPRRVQLW